MAAEQGFETAQANVAFLLDQSKPRFAINLASFVPLIRRKASLVGDAALALIYWTRSAKQTNIDSMVKMGDYYLEGFGTSLDQEKAAACYLAAAETLQSAQAMWNLGWMHENGIGIEQDFHLAKRFYDQALETNPKEAYLPVLLSLYKLRLRSWWNTVTNGRINSIQDDPVPHKDWSVAEWINNFLEADAAAWETIEPDDYATGHDHMPGGDDDYYEDIESDILESAIILALTGALAFLVYYRAQRQRRAEERRQQQQQQGQGQGQADNALREEADDQGAFPQRNDPEFLNWAAGGVGH